MKVELYGDDDIFLIFVNIKKFYKMKKIVLIVFMTLSIFQVRSQNQEADPANTGRKFFVGLSYSYMSLDLKLTDLSLHSVWAGQAMGTYNLSSDEIDEINAFTERSSTVNAVCAEAGMPLFNKPGSKWYVDGTLMLGVAQTYRSTYNKNSGKEEYNYNSGFSKPYFGLGFNVAYQFNPKWGVVVRPLFSATMGSESEITDNINAVPENFTQTIEDDYSTYYERISLLGSYNSGNFSLYAGPGFYWVNSNHDYIIEQTNMTNGDIIKDEINTKGIARSFIDGNIAVEWIFTKPLTFYAHAGFGNDVFINTGLHYNF
jgi:hypothetical protein